MRRIGTGTTALMLAAVEGYPETVRALLALGADATAPNRDGQTALMLAHDKNDRLTLLVLTTHLQSKRR